MIDRLDIKEYLSLNAKLQTKKNNLRKLLNEKGVLKKEGNNTFDKYKYFSEAQYKELFTELFSACSLELKFTELSYDTFEGSEKQSNGRMPRLEFTLLDCDTGFYERTIITGEGIDKGDKAGYKAYTGALKYYLANTFMVATGDDPETESPEAKMNDKKSKPTYSKNTNAKAVAPKDEPPKEETPKNEPPKELSNRDRLVIFCKDNGLDPNSIAKEYNLNGKSSPQDFLDVLIKLGGEVKGN